MNCINMNIEKSKAVLSFFGALLAVGLSCSMLVGTAYGRYSTTITGELEYDVKTKPTPTVTYPETHIVSGEGVWLVKEDEQTLKFTLGNGETETSPGRDMAFRIRVFLKASEESTEDPIKNKSLKLKIDGSAVYTATHSALNEESALYAKLGVGWVYTFESNNAEIIHTITSDAESPLGITLTVDTDADLSGYALLIDSVYTAETETD